MANIKLALSGVNTIDGILWDGWRWQGAAFTYGFPNTSDQYPTVNTGFATLSTLQRDAVRLAFRELNSFLGVTFSEGGATGTTIRLANASSFDSNNDSKADSNVGTAWGGAPSDDNETAGVDGDVWFNPGSYTNPLAGSYQFASGIIHEIGHALGLKHPHDTNGGAGTLGSDWDGMAYTIMSYKDYPGDAIDNIENNNNQPQSYMMLDIAALQYLYGANFVSNGNTVYRWTPTIQTGFGSNFFVNGAEFEPTVDLAANVVFRTVWDSGGFDTYDFSLYTTNLTVNLNPGQWTSLGTQLAQLEDSKTAPGNIANAMLFNNDTRSLIETVIGGFGNDAIKGNQVSNRLEGRDGNDVIEGFDGFDSLLGGNGTDYLYGGNSADWLQGGLAPDYLDGGAGNDTVSYADMPYGITAELYFDADTTLGHTDGKITAGDWGLDTLVSIETIEATNYDDVLLGDERNNTFYGLGGNDRMEGDGGSSPQASYDQLYGGSGNDILQGGPGGDYLDGGADFDIATFLHGVTVNLQTGARAGEAISDTYVNIEQFNGSPESDTFVASNSQGARFAGGDGTDYLYGLDQQDWLQGGRGSDYISGGNGFDMVSYADAPYGITAEMYFDADTTLGHTEGKITAGEWGLDTLVSIEDVEGSQFGDVLLGDERSNKLVGLGGDDRIEGDGGSTPQGSSDILEGGAGNDRIVIGVSDFANGGADFDTASFVGGAVYLNFTSNTFTVGGQGFYLAEFEQYLGTEFSDTVYGTGGSDWIDLGAGNDFLYGQGGNDYFYTGPGADVMSGGNGFDTMVLTKTMVADWQTGILDADIASDSWSSWEAIQGSGGNDVIRTNSWGYSIELLGGGGNDVLATGVTGVVSDTLKGEEGNDTLNAGAGDDYLYGQNGDDVLYCGPGADYMDCGDGFDTIAFHKPIIADWQAGNLDADIANDLWFNWEAIQGSSGNDTIRSGVWDFAVTFLGGAGDDSLDATASGNTSDDLQGESGNDQINAGDGADSVTGGTGDDYLTGGLGGDLFLFNLGDGVDEITDDGVDNTGVNLLKFKDLLSADVVFGRSDVVPDNLVLTYGATDRITVQGFFGANGAYSIGQFLFSDGSILTQAQVIGMVVGNYPPELTGIPVELPDGLIDTQLTLYASDLLQGYTDADGDGLTIANLTADVGVLLDQLDGTWTFTPGLGYTGVVNLTYDIIDGRGGVTPVNQAFNVELPNNLPVIASTTVALATVTATSVDLSGTVAFTDIDSTDVHSVTPLAATGSAGGNFTASLVEADGAGVASWTYSFAIPAVYGASVKTKTDIFALTVDDGRTGQAIETIAIKVKIGSNGKNSLTGTSGIDILLGGGGYDKLNGLTGNDVLLGGLGNDQYLVNDVNAVLYENADEGNDTVKTAIDYSLADNFEALILTGVAALSGTGNDLANVLTGNSGNNILIGLAGADTLKGQDGNDTFEVNITVLGTLEDKVIGGNGLDTIKVVGNAYVNPIAQTLFAPSDVENVDISGTADALLNITGNILSNLLTGNEANNVLVGGKGADTLQGNEGSDTLTGGDAVDVFLFDKALGPDNVDVITDFASAVDQLQFSKAAAGLSAVGTKGQLKLNDVRFEANDTGIASLAKVRLVYNTATGELAYDSDGSGGAAPVVLDVLANAATLTAMDIWVV